MLRVFTSNRLEALTVALGRQLEQPPAANPLQREVIIVERGVDRWLWQQLAERFGIAAGLDLQLPAGFVWNTLRRQFPRAPERSPWERDALAWRLLALLDPAALANDPAYATAQHYLAGDDDQRKRFQLARRLADLFDQYQVYRHRMLLDWEQGKSTGVGDDEEWQMKLWQRAVAGAGNHHRAHLIEKFFDAANRGALDTRQLPARVSVFAVPALPPVYLQVLAVIGREIPVDIHALNPCATFWGDALRAGERAAEFARYGEAAALQLADGNPLLANGGSRSQQYFLDLAELDAQPTPELFIAPGNDTMLARVQRAIFDNAPPAATTIGQLDDSLQIHACYSLQREIEVLHDRLIDAFEQDPSLAPHEILVLTPDIEMAAPCIDAVFSAARGTPREIPWVIADLARGSEHPLAAALRSLLALPDSRFTASEVLGLLETPAVARRFGLHAADLGLLRQRVQAAGIRWGLDAGDRARRGLPASDEHSWQFGLERLFLGLAMDDGDTLVEGRAPFVDIEGSDGIALGKLQAFIDRLEEFRRRLAQPKDAAGWHALLSQLLAAFFQPEGADEDKVADDIAEAAREFRAELRLSGHAGDIPPAVFRADFESRLAQPATRGGLLRGALTFAQLTPARSLPFRMICLVGMNHDAFPRRQTPLTFDLVAARPRRGDRSRRDDDRQLFLETLLAAGERLYISYTGRSLRDSAPKQPSVVVDELIDAVIGPQTDPRQRETLRQALVVQHPLQPFATRQYDGSDPRLFSYDPDWLPAVNARGGNAPSIAFCPQPLPYEPPATLRLTDLHRCLTHPARWFLQRRLGVFFDAHDNTTLADDEPFTLADDFAVNDGWLDAALAGRDASTHFALLAARGELPQGVFAALDWQARVERLAPLVARLQADDSGWAPRDFTLALPGGRTLAGRLARVQGNGQRVVSTLDRPHPRLLLQAWIDHLVWCALHGGDAETRIETLGETGILRAPARPAVELLADLAALADEAHRQPLRFFPKSAWKLVSGKTPEAGRKSAYTQWQGGYNNKPAPESADRNFRACFGHEQDPLGNDAFAAIAARVLSPLKAALSGSDGNAKDDAGDDA